MIRFLIGLFVGLSIASAIAQSPWTLSPGSDPPRTAMRAGFDQDGTAHVIQVDRKGYVICSDEQKPQEENPNGQ